MVQKPRGNPRYIHDHPPSPFFGAGRAGPTTPGEDGWSLRLGGLRLLESGLAPWLIGRDRSPKKTTWKPMNHGN